MGINRLADKKKDGHNLQDKYGEVLKDGDKQNSRFIEKLVQLVSIKGDEKQ